MDDDDDVGHIWPLTPRHLKLPLWAQDEIMKLRCESINRDMGGCVGDQVRNYTKIITGTNCTFSDTDVHLLALLAKNACDADLLDGLEHDEDLCRSIRKEAQRRKKAKDVVNQL